VGEGGDTLDSLVLFMGERRLRSGVKGGNEVFLVEIQRVTELSTVERMWVDRLLCYVGGCTSGEELLGVGQHVTSSNQTVHSYRVAKAEDAAILDVEVDMAVGNLDAANELAGIDMCDSRGAVGVRV